MTNAISQSAIFEKDFAHFERNRMYPLGYGKELTMQTLKHDHVDAISHAETYIHPAIIPNMPPHQRNEIEKDLARLAEVKRYILKLIYAPGLIDRHEIPEETKLNGNKARDNTDGS